MIIPSPSALRWLTGNSNPAHQPSSSSLRSKPAASPVSLSLGLALDSSYGTSRSHSPLISLTADPWPIYHQVLPMLPSVFLKSVHLCPPDPTLLIQASSLAWLFLNDFPTPTVPSLQSFLHTVCRVVFSKCTLHHSLLLAVTALL